jgi:hypothetical protein
MGPIPINVADIIVLAVIVAIVALIVRGMLRGAITSCDCGSCSGNCGSCGSTCATPRIRLTKEQLDELDTLTRQAKEA